MSSSLGLALHCTRWRMISAPALPVAGRCCSQASSIPNMGDSLRPYFETAVFVIGGRSSACKPNLTRAVDVSLGDHRDRDSGFSSGDAASRSVRMLYSDALNGSKTPINSW